MPDNRWPSPPAGWNKTLDDLDAEIRSGARKSLSGVEVHWAREYELGLLPSDIRFPKEGDVYEAIADTHVKFTTQWRMPFTGGGEGLLKAGERIRVDTPSDSRPLAVGAKPLDYHNVEKRLVPESDRTTPKYGGFELVVRTLDLNRKFKLVSSGTVSDAK